jgi:hypothetical protein
MRKNGVVASQNKKRLPVRMAEKRKFENKVIFRAQVIKGKIKLWD